MCKNDRLSPFDFAIEAAMQLSIPPDTKIIELFILLYFLLAIYVCVIGFDILHLHLNRESILLKFYILICKSPSCFFFRWVRGAQCRFCFFKTFFQVLEHLFDSLSAPKVGALEQNRGNPWKIAISRDGNMMNFWTTTEKLISNIKISKEFFFTDCDFFF